VNKCTDKEGEACGKQLLYVHAGLILRCLRACRKLPVHGLGCITCVLIVVAILVFKIEVFVVQYDFPVPWRWQCCTSPNREFDTNVKRSA
jgi:hypothetical protein